MKNTYSNSQVLNLLKDLEQLEPGVQALKGLQTSLRAVAVSLKLRKTGDHLQTIQELALVIERLNWLTLRSASISRCHVRQAQRTLRG